MKKIIYNTIGNNYNNHRIADKRIVDGLISLLDVPGGSTIADIGAGTGNYSNAMAERGYKVKAIEPSKKMRAQGITCKNVIWVDGRAESIPLPDDSVDGVVVVLATHHFSSLRRSVMEFSRICPRGPLVIFTFDPRECVEFWFTTYFPEIWQQALHSFPPINDIAHSIAEQAQWSFKIRKFLIPHDLADGFMGVGWNKPELYLDARVRRSMSGFSLAEKSVVRRGIRHLNNDLESGVWDKNYGYLRQQKDFDGGYRFVRFIKGG